MYHGCLIALFFMVFLISCSAQPPEETPQDPNVTPEGVRITTDVVYGHRFRYLGQYRSKIPFENPGKLT
jgi:hypothetical protein